MKKSLLALLATTALVSALPTSLMAVDVPNSTSNSHKSSTYQEAREKLKKMTPEQRQAFMEKARTKWDKLTPEEKKTFKVKMRERMAMMKKQNAERKIIKLYSLYLLEQEQSK